MDQLLNDNVHVITKKQKQNKNHKDRFAKLIYIFYAYFAGKSP